MAKIIGIGNALVDIMTLLPNDNVLEKFELPKGSMQLVSKEFSLKLRNEITPFIDKRTAGGSAANTINGLANLGIETAFIGKIGKDELGNYFRNDLEKNSILPKLFLSNSETGSAIALISKDSERTFAVDLGAAIELSANDLTTDLFKGYGYLHIEGYLVQNHELLESAIRMAKTEGLKISLDLASFNVVEANLDFLQKIVKSSVDIVFANEEEAKSFTGESPEVALDILAQSCEIAIVKIGSKGSLIKSNGKTYQVGTSPVKCIDTTGAGDLYASGFLYGLANNLGFEKCGQLGTILAGNVIEVIGAKMDKDRWAKIKNEVSKVSG